MNFCPQCGTRFEPEARFCRECGFDKNSVIVTTELIPEPVIISPAPENVPITPEIPVIPQPSVNTPAVKPGEPTNPKKRKKPLLWIVLIACVLGTAAWFGYNRFFNVPVGNLVKAGNEATDTVAESNTAPLSLMDQELAKQSAKVKSQSPSNNPSKQDSTEIAVPSEKDIISTIILEVGRKEEPKHKNPKNPAKLTLRKPTMITRITTDHYNNGMGTPRGGIITINDRGGMVIAAYKALGKTGKNGTPSASWIAEPNRILEKGTYFIWDSDNQTWSKTLLGNGFIVVEGYEVE